MLDTLKLTEWKISFCLSFVVALLSSVSGLMDIFNLDVMIAGCCTCLIVTSISFVLRAMYSIMQIYKQIMCNWSLVHV